MRFLACQDIAHFVYLDTLSLPTLTRKDFWTSLSKELGAKVKTNDEQELVRSCRDQIEVYLKSNQNLVFIFNRLDELDNEISRDFLTNLRTLRHLGVDRISIILVSHTPFEERFPEAISGSNLDMYTNYLYFKPYSRKDLEQLSNLFTPNFDAKRFEQAFQLSGGHYQLLQLILKSNRSSAFLLDKPLLLSLKIIFESLSLPDRKVLQKIVYGKKTTVPHYLLQTGLVLENQKGFELFSPLFAEYILSRVGMKLPAMEAKLFRFLKTRLGKVVTKDEIFSNLWSENDDGYGSDWALNAVVYRLRRNPTFQASGYILESHKKIGYSLIKM